MPFDIFDAIPACLNIALLFSDDDKVKFCKALQLSVVDIDWFSRIGLQLSEGELENVKSDCNNNRSNLILKVMEKWCENLQENATPNKLIEILDQVKLVQVKHLWWAEYFNQEDKICFQNMIEERRRLFDNITDPNISEIVWREFELKLNMSNKRNEAVQRYPNNPRHQRFFVLDQWTLEKGYNEASNTVLMQHWESGNRNASASDRNTDDVTSSTSRNPFKHDIGLYYVSDDHNIAARIKTTLEQMKYSVCLFDFYVCSSGISKVDKPTYFFDDCICVFWIATHSSTNCEGYSKEYRIILEHLSIKKQNERGAKNFIVLFPEEVSNNHPKLPASLDAYDPLIEDSSFIERVEHTYNRIKKKYNDKLAKRSSNE